MSAWTNLRIATSRADRGQPASRPVDRSERLAVLIATAAVGLAGVFVSAYAWYAPSIGIDAMLVVKGARLALEGASPYTDATGELYGAASLNFYGPPALALLYVPLALLPDAVLVRIVLVGTYVVALASLALLVAGTRIDRTGRAMLVIGLLASYALLGAASLGNPSILVLLALAVAAWGIRRDRAVVAGAAIGTAAALRLYPVVLLLPLLLARRWREVAAAVATIGAWGLAGIAAFGLDDTIRYLGLAMVVGNPPDAAHIVINANLASVAARLGAPEAVISVVRLVSIGLGAAALVHAGRLLRPGSSRDRQLLGLGFGAAGMLLIPAAFWDHYLTALVVLVVGIVAVTGRARWGVLSAGLLPAAMGGGLAAVWLPAVALATTRHGTGDQTRDDAQ